GQQVAGIGPNWRFVSKAPLKPAIIKDYPDAVDQAAARLCNSVAAVAKSARDQELSLNTSGDFGSRLALAAAAAAGVKNIKVQYSGPRDAKTEQIAVQLASQFGLNSAKSPAFPGGQNVDLMRSMRQSVFLQQGLSVGVWPFEITNRHQNLSIFDTQGIELLDMSWALADTENLFRGSSLQSIAKISNSDPVHSVYLKALMRGAFNSQKRRIARAAYEICNKHDNVHNLFRRDFLRSSSQEILAQLQQSLMDDTTPISVYLSRSKRRNIGITGRIACSQYGYHSLFADPVLLECAS
ncbi:unnamed protein product, partial [Ectocarpus sp. 13 AM-2016]